MIVCDDWRRMLDDINSNRLRLSTFALSHSPNYTYTRTQYEEREFKSIKLMNWIRCLSSFAIDWIHNSSFNHHHGICPIPFTWAPHDHRTSNELNLFLLDGIARYMCGVRLTSRWTDFFNHLIHWHSSLQLTHNTHWQQQHRFQYKSLETTETASMKHLNDIDKAHTTSHYTHCSSSSSTTHILELYIPLISYCDYIPSINCISLYYKCVFVFICFSSVLLLLLLRVLLCIVHRFRRVRRRRLRKIVVLMNLLCRHTRTRNGCISWDSQKTKSKFMILLKCWLFVAIKKILCATQLSVG